MEPIKADYVGMMDKSENLWHLTSKLQHEIALLKGVLNDIDIFWEGEANNAFHLALNEDFLIMEALCLKFKLSAKLIRDAIDEYSKAEDIINRAIGGL